MIGGANFTADNVSGVTIIAANLNDPWGGAPNFGATPSDDNLELLMQSIRWSAAPGNVQIDLANLIAGQDYKLQLLFQERCCARGFDVESEGVIIAPSFSPTAIHGGSSTTVGAVITQQFLAGDTTLNLRLLPTGLFGDNNPIIQGFTLEVFPDAIATPSSDTLHFIADKGVTHTQTLTIANTGETGSTLYLNSATITGADSADFQILDFVANTQLEVGEEIDLLIQYTGQDPFTESFATLTFATNMGPVFGATSGGQSLSITLNAIAAPEPTALTLWAGVALAALGHCSWRRVKRRN